MSVNEETPGGHRGLKPRTTGEEPTMNQPTPSGPDEPMIPCPTWCTNSADSHLSFIAADNLEVQHYSRDYVGGRRRLQLWQKDHYTLDGELPKSETCLWADDELLGSVSDLPLSELSRRFPAHAVAAMLLDLATNQRVARA